MISCCVKQIFRKMNFGGRGFHYLIRFSLVGCTSDCWYYCGFSLQYFKSIPQRFVYKTRLESFIIHLKLQTTRSYHHSSSKVYNARSNAFNLISISTFHRIISDCQKKKLLRYENIRLRALLVYAHHTRLHYRIHNYMYSFLKHNNISINVMLKQINQTKQKCSTKMQIVKTSIYERK